jgi:16S rRNA (cytosine1402-N4)-methyltransferase
MATEHQGVLKSEVLQWLDPRPGGAYVDGTVGGGGHTRLLAERVGPTGLVIGFDRDPGALRHAEPLLAELPVRLLAGNFSTAADVLPALGVDAVDGILLDLGMSSDQLSDATRGFSFDAAGPLDLRFDTGEGEPAWKLLQRLSERHLADLIYEYGEERFSRRIAKNVVIARRRSTIRTSRDLTQIVCDSIPRSVARKQRIHPATRTFQALRIAVNNELGSLERALERFPEILRPGGRLAIISFHSLEDRRVKNAFREDPRYAVLTKKPIRPNEEELSQNPRSRSARLRIGEKCEV